MDLLKLPDESLLNILSFLDVKDLVSLSSVCKLFRRIVEDDSLWEDFCRRIFIQRDLNAKGSASWKELYISSYQIRQVEAALQPKIRFWSPIPVENFTDLGIQTIHDIRNVSRHIHKTTNRVVHLLNLLLQIWPDDSQTKSPTDPFQNPRVLSILIELGSIFKCIFEADALKQLEPRIQVIWNFYRYCLMSMKTRPQPFLEINDEITTEAQMYNNQFHLGVEPTDFLSRSDVSDVFAQSQPYKHSLRWAFSKCDTSEVCEIVLPKIAELIVSEYKKHDKGKPNTLFTTQMKDNVEHDWFWGGLLAGVLLLYDAWGAYSGIYRKDAPFHLKECLAFLLKAEQNQKDKAWKDLSMSGGYWNNVWEGLFCKSLMYCSRNYKDSAPSSIKKMLKRYE